MTGPIAWSCWGAVRSRSRSWSNRCSCSSRSFRAVSVRLRISCSIRSRSGGASGSASSSRCRSEKAALSSAEAWVMASRYAATSASPHCAAANSTSLVASLSASSVASSARFASRLSWSAWAAAALARARRCRGRPADEEDAAAEQQDHEHRGEVDPGAAVARSALRRHGRRLACRRGGGRRRDRGRAWPRPPSASPPSTMAATKSPLCRLGSTASTRIASISASVTPSSDGPTHSASDRSSTATSSRASLPPREFISAVEAVKSVTVAPPVVST